MRANPAAGIAILVVHTALILDGAIRGVPTEMVVLVMAITATFTLDVKKAFSAWMIVYRAGMSATVFSFSWPLAFVVASYVGGKHNGHLIEFISNEIFIVGGPELACGLLAMLLFKLMSKE